MKAAGTRCSATELRGRNGGRTNQATVSATRPRACLRPADIGARLLDVSSTWGEYIHQLCFWRTHCRRGATHVSLLLEPYSDERELNSPVRDQASTPWLPETSERDLCRAELRAVS